MYCRRRQLHPVRIGGFLLNARGKLYTLLWQIWAAAGGDVMSMRRFCQQVRSITTDFGTEKALADHGDILRSFANAHGLSLPDEFVDLPRQFPLAIHQPGWCHIIDTLLRRGLCSLRY